MTRAPSAPAHPLILDTIPAMAWTVQPDGTVDYVNRPWLEYSGLSLEEFFKDPMGTVHPDDVPGVMEKWGRHMAAGDAYEDEMRLRRADGEYRWFLVRTVPLRNERGDIVKWHGTSTDIEDRKRAEEMLRQSAAELRAMSRQLVELQESERRDLSRELHDRVGQNLTALKIDLDILRPAVLAHGDDDLRARIDDSAALLASTIDAIDNVTAELRPHMLDDLGLAPALEWHAKQFSKRTGIAVTVRGGGLPHERRSPEVEIALYRIAQEALNNVAKHARARHVEIDLDHTDGECTMSVEDDGTGFDNANPPHRKAKPGLGLVTMRERAQAVGARFELRKRPGGGTRLTVRLPREAPQRA